MNLETVKNNINALVDSNPNLIMDIEYFLKEKKAYFKRNGIKYGYRGYAGFKPKQESEDIAKTEPSTSKEYDTILDSKEMKEFNDAKTRPSKKSFESAYRLYCNNSANKAFSKIDLDGLWSYFNETSEWED